jgi:lipopolysaccharide transport system permease protein
MDNRNVIETEKWTTVIKPKTSLFDIDFKEIFRYRDLCEMFVKRDIITRYKQTVLGPLWFFIQPILTTVMFMVVFGGIAKISTDNLPQPLFYLAGICVWNYFSTCLNSTSSVFISNQGIFGKVYFPRLIMPISTTISTLITFGIQLILFIVVYILYAVEIIPLASNAIMPTPRFEYLALAPVLIIMLAGLSLGFGIIISSMTTKYRDLSLLFSFLVQLWMYATPVIYPLSMMSPFQQRIAALNPVTSVVETFRYATLGTGTFSWWQLGYSFGFMCVVMLIGIVIFNKVQRSFMDTV